MAEVHAVTSWEVNFPEDEALFAFRFMSERQGSLEQVPGQWVSMSPAAAEQLIATLQDAVARIRSRSAPSAPDRLQ
jgi:hypothetical protein